MTALSTRDALAKALLTAKHPENPDAPLPMVRAGCAGILAEALLASGAVIDAATLAEPFGDVLGDVARAIEGQAASLPESGSPVTVARCYSEGIARTALRALAAALTERGEGR